MFTNPGIPIGPCVTTARTPVSNFHFGILPLLCVMRYDTNCRASRIGADERWALSTRDLGQFSRGAETPPCVDALLFPAPAAATDTSLHSRRAGPLQNSRSIFFAPVRTELWIVMRPLSAMTPLTCQFERPKISESGPSQHDTESRKSLQVVIQGVHARNCHVWWSHPWRTILGQSAFLT